MSVCKHSTHTIDALRGLLSNILSYEPSIYNQIMRSVFYPMKDSGELHKAVTYINEKCNGSEEIYYNEVKVFANKIASWFLECKYNPHYKYCRDRVNSGYDKLFE